ncbi:MAG: hypothetical protein L0Z73_18810 [Gammaproteobacteria bacterium]|nr:hypothetical protein [Gammaproteobacteria bacterium]
MNIRNLGHDKWELTFFIALSVTTFLMISSMSSAYANNTNVNTNSTYRDQAKRMHDRLTGVPPTEETLNIMANYIDPDVDGTSPTGTNPSADPVTAARYAIDHLGGNPRAKYFYNVTLKNWITPWTNEEQTIFAPLNDYTALVIGMIRDDVAFNTVLSADLFYTGTGAGLPAFSNMNNDHFEALENNDVDLSDPSQFTSRPQNNLNGAPAGIVTTRQAGKAFFSAGTNRAMFRFTSMNYLCRDLEDLKDVTRVPDRIRQDVSRSPGGDSSIFLNSCVGCHAGMDPLAQAYAYYEWVEDADGNNGHTIYTPGDVQAKYHINSTNFEYGFRTPNDNWTNYWREGPNAGLGWNGPSASGTGAASMGIELTSTDAFAQCQVEKVYKQVCLQEPISNHNSAIESLASRFMDTGDMNYRMKDLFAEVAALCMGN